MCIAQWSGHSLIWSVYVLKPRHVSFSNGDFKWLTNASNSHTATAASMFPESRNESRNASLSRVLEWLIDGKYK